MAVSAISVPDFAPISRRFQMLEALVPEDQKTVIEVIDVIDAMITKQCIASALTPVDTGV